MNCKRLSVFAGTVVPAVVLAFAGAVAADEFEITRSTIDGGGMMWITGGEFELCGTIGQPDAGAAEMSGGDLTLTGGFWFPLAAGDGNMDGGVDLVDYQDFEVCMSGPESGAPPSECRSFDIDGDDDVDLSDVARFQRSFTGG